MPRQASARLVTAGPPWAAGMVVSVASARRVTGSAKQAFSAGVSRRTASASVATAALGAGSAGGAVSLALASGTPPLGLSMVEMVGTPLTTLIFSRSTTWSAVLPETPAVAATIGVLNGS